MSAESGTLIHIREQRDALTPANRRIAEYILKNPERIVRMSIRELAKESHASDAAVMRFCKAVGIKGYRDLIVGLSTALGAKEESTAGQFSDIKPGDTPPSIIRNISYSNRQSIDDTLQVLSEKEVEKAAALLKKASRIASFGIGASALVAMDIQQKFSRIGRVCHAYTDSHEQMTSAVLLEEADVAVVVSNSGETREIVEVLGVLKEGGVPVVAITRRESSPLGRGADVLLGFSTPEITLRSGAMGSRIAMLNIVDILYACVASQQYETVQKNLARTRQALKRR